MIETMRLISNVMVVGDDLRYLTMLVTIKCKVSHMTVTCKVETSRENCTRVLSCTFSRVLEYSSTGDTLNLHK